MRLTTDIRRAATGTLRTLALSAVLVGAVQAAPITLQFASADAVVNGANTDIRIVLQADTANYFPTGGIAGGGAYYSLTATVFSTGLGLAGVQASSLVAVLVGLPDLAQPDIVGLFSGGGNLSNVLPVNWDGVSSISASSLASSTTGTGVSLTIGGMDYAIETFDTANNVNDASFSATLRPTNPVPEPASLALAGLALAGLAVQRARKATF